jgi:hypothetical protein
LKNDDRASEITLVPMYINGAQWTPREEGTVKAAAQIWKDLADHWRNLDDLCLSITRAPTISLMTLEKVLDCIVSTVSEPPS